MLSKYIIGITGALFFMFSLVSDVRAQEMTPSQAKKLLFGLPDLLGLTITQVSAKIEMNPIKTSKNGDGSIVVIWGDNEYDEEFKGIFTRFGQVQGKLRCSSFMSRLFIHNGFNYNPNEVRRISGPAKLFVPTKVLQNHPYGVYNRDLDLIIIYINYGALEGRFKVCEINAVPRLPNYISIREGQVNDEGVRTSSSTAVIKNWKESSVVDITYRLGGTKETADTVRKNFPHLVPLTFR